MINDVSCTQTESFLLVYLMNIMQYKLVYYRVLMYSLTFNGNDNNVAPPQSKDCMILVIGRASWPMADCLHVSQPELI